jgi:diguanylate cyclase (GGDEF)-like protein/PAS domain S-box-containing protein
MANLTTPRESRLSAFIRANLEEILVEWEVFAKDLPAARRMGTGALRDHAGGMMLAIADDLDRTQTPYEQLQKSRGRAPPSAGESEAERHGAARVASGFTVTEALSEFRALRASVLRLWWESANGGRAPPEDETIRFNEAIDQALTESLLRYGLDKEETTRQFDTLLSASPDLQYILDDQGSFLYANRTLARLFGKTPDEIIGHGMGSLCPELAQPLNQALHAARLTHQPHVREMRCHADPAKPVTYRNVIIPVVSEGGTVGSFSGNARNITELKLSEEAIARHAYYDFLTDLPNRLLFRDRLAQEAKHAERSGRTLALLYIDLDGFKEVNDRYGHAEGDALLQEAARRLASCVRSSDTVARLGGDEFTVLLTDVARVPHVEVMAQEILTELAQPFTLQGKPVQISGSIGITLFPQDAASPEELVRCADQAMFVAKKAGRNRFSFFTAEMRDAAWARLKVVDELRVALERRQLSVYYQPIVDMASGAIVKAEALVRWHHPENGLIMPTEFISLAEETGLIGEVGALVLDDVVVQAQHWRALLGTPFQISVNKSPVEFMDRSALRGADPDLARLQAAADQVTVEITEGVMLSDSPPVREKLRLLKQAGVQLAIDDFGIGYSSLSYLKKFSVDFLKIDQSFVKDMMVDDESRVFAETIIVMAHKLGLQVIAEGVETADQRDWLRNAGCDFAQGFLYAEARNAQQFEQLLVASHGPQAPAQN